MEEPQSVEKVLTMVYLVVLVHKLLVTHFFFELQFVAHLFSSLRRRANARNVSTSFLLYGGITYFINSFDYPNLLHLLCTWAINNMKGKNPYIRCKM